ncbi:uncharacterized protein EV420DRAFT_1650720 [Desarmillaria tabescens]|uniref:Uncharacterized protein n=1 Tax=Armillaria tabescens TaxID=1929756 RepID=A0AA39JC06_ARMTA|nr:uncharacterized protein EV420DRAFT_1650720 [Desarmillaria tabescens]KAK0439957.1 hypothetical protein EV420DRAFT_1650720 [Desarmillaria tabescens]
MVSSWIEAVRVLTQRILIGSILELWSEWLRDKRMSSIRVGWNPVEFDLASFPSSPSQSWHESKATAGESTAGRFSPPVFISRPSLLCEGNLEGNILDITEKCYERGLLSLFKHQMTLVLQSNSGSDIHDGTEIASYT